MNLSRNKAASYESWPNDSLSLNYQMQYDLASGKPFAAEALLRENGRRGNKAPAELIAKAEQDGTISLITLWVVEQVLRDFSALRRRYGIERVAVNVSAVDMSTAGFVTQVEKRLKQSSLNGSCLELEITENLPLVNLRQVLDNIGEARALGMRVVLDDFGKGFTSMSALTQLPVDGIKLDKMFSLNLMQPKYYAIAESLVSLCEKLDISVLIEGIEDRIARDSALSLGCGLGQGYYLHNPESKADLTRINAKEKGLIIPLFKRKNKRA